MRGVAAFVDHGRRTTHKCYNLYSTVEILTTRDGPAMIDAKAIYWSKIAIFAPVRDTQLDYCHNVWYEKNRLVWLPGGDKNEHMFTSFDRIHERDGRKDTARRHRLCLCRRAVEI